MKRKILVACAGTLLAWSLSASSLLAAEPAQAFLDGLRDKEYFDTAIEYLEAAAKNPAVPVEFKQKILFEKGITLVQGARKQRDPALRELQLDEGQKVLTQFTNEQKQSVLVIAARQNLGNVIVERARARLDKSAKLAAAEKAAMVADAQKLYTEAIGVFDTLVTELAEKLKGYPAALDAKKDARRIEERDQYRLDYLQAQLLGAITRELLADSFPDGAKGKTDNLALAIKEYTEIYSKYRTRIAGLNAHLFRGRCEQKLGKHKEAVAIFTELLANPNEPDAFRKLKLDTAAVAVVSWNALKQYNETITKGTPVIDSARASEDRSDELQLLRVQVAKATKLYADELKAKDPKNPQIKKLLTDGRKLVTYVAKFPGPQQEAARRMIPDFTGGDAESLAERPEPKTFLEAREAAKQAVDAMKVADLVLKTVPARVAQTKDPKEKAALEAQLTEAKQATETARQDALRYLRLALRFSDKETDVADLNTVRYLLCFFLFGEKQYHDAIVLGEFVANRYPESQGARACAKIAMASYIQLFAESKSADKSYESGRIISVADYIVKKWPDQPEAEEALNTLIPFMIREKRIADAEDYLAKIPAESQFRGIAELKTGQALWGTYLDTSRQLREWENGTTEQPEGTDIAKVKAELEVLRSKAKSTLENGVNRMKAGTEISKWVTDAVLYLTQIYVETGEADKAVTLLEDPKVGIITLLKANDPSTQRDGFAEETYKTALRCYISSLATSKDPDATVAKAKEVMQSLKDRMGATPEGQQKLVSIYYSLARDLQGQMERADATAKSGLGKGFEAFLGQVGKDSTELNVLNWVAETYRGMGESFATSDPGKVSPEAKRYLDQAVVTYNKILDTGAKKQGFLSEQMNVQIQLQVAKTKRALGDFEGSINEFEKILKTSNNNLVIQQEAARTFQSWGSAKSLPDRYSDAIFGARPDNTKNGKRTIWGWAQIAAMTAANAKFRDSFFEARYNLAVARFGMANTTKDTAKKGDITKSAKRDIELMARLYPDLGGDKWRPQFDALCKRIQTALKEPPIGLKEFPPPTVVPKTTPAAAPAAGAPAAAPAKSTPTSAPAAKPAPAKAG
ncbi:hypothetical protein Psta_4184 [Pirellula staleyi DSM 6068]|uniref:Tetratricopeptide domain protein n=1 Tax=Pirellula staleyi (strain ATCC 27377 / DSM 6068 / ICPB 4128) TaxID=530564 RepID=D2R3Y4_PIRSD|nr:hypothetical protein [Pirellula staleyi]ADB18833.1 hypothetical protein Psta_4184 [Pirellula staleyi DSM 6068]